MKLTLAFRWLVPLFLVLATYCTTHAVVKNVSGTIRYWDQGTNTYQPLKEVQITIATFQPTVNPAPGLFTDADGHFSYDLNVYPEQVTIFIEFANPKVSLRGFSTVRSHSENFLKDPDQECPPGLPCEFGLSEFSNLQIYLGPGEVADYARVFTLVNNAADFARAHGYDPPQCITKFPSENTIAQNFSIDASSFYWPYETIDTWDIISILPITGLYGLTCLVQQCGVELTSHALYLEHPEVEKDYQSTVYHEYGHFLMGARRGSWPVAMGEYIAGVVPFGHDWTDENQNDRLAWLEGWANFYGAAVEGWVKGQPFSGDFAIDGTPYPGLFESLTNTWLSMLNGYHNEVLIGAALFDYYDASTDEGFQTTFRNLLDITAETDVLTMPQYVNSLVHKTYLTNQTRSKGISLLQNLNMDPVPPYGNVSYTVLNDFESGIMRIDGQLVEFNPQTQKSITRSEIWTNPKRFWALEQPALGYDRVYRHTHPSIPLPTWTSSDDQEFNNTEFWQTFAQALTYTANFDRVCNITVNYILDGTAIVLPGSGSSQYPSRTGLTLVAEDITKDNVRYFFSRWDNGSTNKERSINVQQHETITAYYRAYHTTGNTATLTGSLGSGWNMVSLPNEVGNFSVDAVYGARTPGSVVYSFNGSYVEQSTLALGTGYWAKYPSSTSVPYTGKTLDQLSIPLRTGWNLIGSFSEPYSLSDIRLNDGNSYQSNYFYYVPGGGYVTLDRSNPSSVLTPGLAHWVKVSAPGSLLLEAVYQGENGTTSATEPPPLAPGQPDIVRLKAPPDSAGMNINPASVTFTWHSASGALRYRFQLSTAPDFAPVSLLSHDSTLTGLSKIVTNLNYMIFPPFCRHGEKPVYS